jgi:hypothetical protein
MRSLKTNQVSHERVDSSSTKAGTTHFLVFFKEAEKRRNQLHTRIMIQVFSMTPPSVMAMAIDDDDLVDCFVCMLG